MTGAKKHLALVGAGGGAALATAGAAVVAAAAAAKRWAQTDDPTGGAPLCLPDGEEHTVATPDGGKLSVTTAGNGDRLFVLSHCWTGDRRVWGPVARRLVERGHRVVLYDQRGHGASTAGAAGLTFAALATDVATVLEHVDGRDAVLAGHSMGGMSLQSFAIRHPHHLRERVRGMMLVSTVCGGLSLGRLRDRIAPRLVASAGASRIMSSRRFGPVAVRGSAGRTPALSHLQAVAETFAATPPETRGAFLSAITEMDFAEQLAEVDVPVTVVVGTHDQLTPVPRARELASAIPTARLEVLPDRGHMLPAEAPDELTELLLQL
jgi:pimeloyl-ACP methyl ester carboxylesterase